MADDRFPDAFYDLVCHHLPAVASGTDGVDGEFGVRKFPPIQPLFSERS